MNTKMTKLCAMILSVALILADSSVVALAAEVQNGNLSASDNELTESVEILSDNLTDKLSEQSLEDEDNESDVINVEELNQSEDEETEKNFEIERIIELEELAVITEVDCEEKTDVEITEVQNDDVSIAEEYCRPYVYEINPDGSATILFYAEEAKGALTIPSYLDGHKVTKIGDFAFDMRFGFTSVSLPNTLKAIGDNAFQGCSGLKGDLIIPDSVETIGESAFFLCEGLSGKLTIGNSVKVIEDSAFNGCCFSDLALGNSLQSVGDNAFNGCTFNCELKLPDSLRELKPAAFANCAFKGELKLPSKLTTIGDGAFYDCNGFIGGLTIPNSVTEIGGYAFYGCEKLSGTITIGSGVQDCGYYAFDNIPEITKVVNNSGCTVHLPNLGKSYDEEVLWNVDGKIVQDRMLEPHKTAVLVVNSAEVLFEHTDKDENQIITGRYKVKLDDKEFAKDSNRYNHEIAKAAAGLSTLVYDTHAKYIVSGLIDLGFDSHGATKSSSFKAASNAGIYFGDSTNECTDIAETGKYSPVWITHKEIVCNDEPYNLLCVVIRGTSKTEWIDNFDPGLSDTHEGFDRAATKVAGDINTYITKNKLDISKLKVLVTGHSRGAATANLLGKKIDDGEVSSLSGIDKNNVFIYTFATPNTTRKKDIGADRYNNIYNIVNPEDFVTKVMPVAWGYGRYGVTYSLPSSSLYWVTGMDNQGYQSSFNEYLKDVVNNRRRYENRKDYEPYKKGMETVTNYVKEVSQKVKNVNSYYTRCLNPVKHSTTETSKKTNTEYNLDSLFSLYTETLGYFKSDVKSFKNLSYLAMAMAATGRNPAWGEIGMGTISFFFSHQVLKSDFEKAHEPTTYLAMMEAVSPDYLKADKFYKGVKVSCPVDVVVKDSDGYLVGEVKNNEVIRSDGSLYLGVEGESKTIYLPGDDDYTLEMIGNAEGTMDYTVIEYDPDRGEISRVVYNDVPLTNGNKYTEEIESDKNVDELTLVDEYNQALSPSGVYAEETLGQLSVNVNVVGNGSANGYENLSPGDYVLMSAQSSGPNKFLGWYDEDGNLLSGKKEYGISVMENLELEARFTDNTEGIWVEEPEKQVYMGQAITPEINVYDGDNKLINKTDYSITYKNNTNVYTLSPDDTGFDAKKAPSITVTGKGNYSGTETVYFTIEPKDISDIDITVSDIAPSLEGKNAYTPVPAVTMGKKKLGLKKDFTVSYYLDYSCKKSVVPTVADTYYAKVSGIGSFTGSVVKEFEIAEANKKYVTKLSIGKIADKEYTGELIELSEDELVVKDGPNPLTRNADYKAIITDNLAIGTASVKIIGMGNYIGSKTVTFKIKGLDIGKATLTGFASTSAYDGTEKKQDNLELSYAAKGETPKPIKYIEASEYDELEEDERQQYGATVSYINNVNVGTATILIKGVNNYGGQIKKTYKITPYDIGKEKTDLFTVTLGSESYLYSKAGVNPEPVVEFKNEPLVKGRDYTVGYSNNTAVTDLSGSNVKIPYVKITGKGNFTGIDTSATFNIVAKNISESSGVKFIAKDKVYSDKAGNWKSTYVVMDGAKKLSAPNDYLKDIVFTYESIPDGAQIRDGSDKTKPVISRTVNNLVGASDIVPAGTVIRAKITGAGRMYTGTKETTYRIIAKDINSLKISVGEKKYTGKPITLSMDDIKIDKAPEGVTFEIDETSYTNNTKIGKASVVIRGTGNYGGEKTINYSIVSRKILWWWR